jgi:GEVED domain/Secretion system C-terminal sorting domain/Pregnancy-associated plasma protein-A
LSINKVLASANSYYINSNIQFYLCGSSPNYINNTAYYDFTDTQESALCGANDVTNAINLYFMNSVVSNGSIVGGYAYSPGSGSYSNHLFVKAYGDVAFTSQTLKHELGHYFNLIHTFKNSVSPVITDRELVVRPPNASANCSTTGDLLCDTPSDPYDLITNPLQFNSNCVYPGTMTDAQGQTFTPSPTNIMSYFDNGLSGVSTFTAGQYGRISDGTLLRTDPNNQYILNCSPTVTGVNIPSGLTATVGSTGIVLNFTDNSSNETGFFIERSTTSATTGFVVIGGLGPNNTTFTDQYMASFTTYYYRVKASNSATEYSTVFQIKTGLNYCVPIYNNSCAVVDMSIAYFKLAQGTTTVISNLNSGCSANSYGNFTATPSTVTSGTTYNFTASASPNGSTSVSYFDQHITIWIDYNQNGVFESTEMVYQSSVTGIPNPRMNPTVTGTFTIPSSAASGILRLRIRTGYGVFAQVTDPCASLAYGETEDYALNNISSCPTSLTLTTNVTNGTVAQKASSSITATNQISSGAVTTYQAGTIVSLKPGFRAISGSTFRAKIAGCNTAIREGVVESVRVVPDNQNILSAFPNPANNEVTFEYEVGAGFAELVLYNLMGSQVATVVQNAYHEQGRYSKKFITESLSSGTFLYTLKTNGKQLTKRLVIVK